MFDIVLPTGTVISQFPKVSVSTMDVCPKTFVISTSTLGKLASPRS